VATATPTATRPASPDLLGGPYLGHTTPDSVVISWVTEGAVAGKIRYSLDLSYSNEVPAVRVLNGGHYWHSATIAGLQANTTYNYKVYSDGSDVTPWSQATFATAGDPSVPQFSFAVLGDGRPNDPSAPPSQGARDVAALMDQHSFALVLHTGDMVHSGGICSGSDSSWKQYLRAWLGLYGNTIGRVPVFPALGNHDLDGGSCGYQAFASIFHLPTNAPAGSQEQYYSFDWAGAHFIALDSNQNLHRGSPQHLWLSEDLRNSAHEWKFVFFHHPAYSSGLHGGDALIHEKLPPLFETYGVDVVFSGHDHHYERTCPILQESCVTAAQGGVTYYVTGGAGAPLYTPHGAWFTAYSDSAYHFLLVQVNGCRLSIEAVEASGIIFDRYTLDRCPPSSAPLP
jgi:hypothetical protein